MRPTGHPAAVEAAAEHVTQDTAGTAAAPGRTTAVSTEEHRP
jgi:hypothetical protein